MRFFGRVYAQIIFRMTKKNIVCLSGVILLLLLAIFGNITTSKGETIRLAKYRPVQIPLIVTGEQSRARYLVTNFWKDFDVTGKVSYDTTSVEECFAIYSAAINQLTNDESVAYITDFAAKVSESEPFSKRFLSYADRYLYHPNSPYRNEDCYIAFLEGLLKNRAFDDASCTYSYVQRLTVLKKNRVGYIAANIAMKNSISEQCRLYDVKADYTLLLLYDPECETCKKVIRYLAENVKINQLLNNKKLAVFAVNPDGFSELWLQKSKIMPQSWIIGYDEERQIRASQLYDLKALPSLYLLDKKKMVLIKDGNVEEIVERLSGIAD